LELAVQLSSCGVSALRAVGGQTQLNAIAAGIAMPTLVNLGLVIALVFVVAGVGFKISAAPSVDTDVYEGALHQSLPSYLSVQKQLVCLSNPSMTTAFPLITDEWRFVFTALAV